MLLILDNYDSFTYNVFQLLSELGAEVEVIRNDQTTVEDIRAKKYDAIVLSPGPGIPSDAGITEQVIRELGGEVPILGICLGHQAIGEVFGGKVVRAGEIVHGKTSPLHHNGKGLYEGIPQNVPIGRYHSLVIDRATLPDCLEVTSDLADGTIMGVRHKAKNIEGIQFHPESILTPDGKKMMENFLKHL
ncbi:MAG: aminodeoxychorismate/anthranilate synthase component II [Veillonellaceae bacterium]|uniref:anthranilate synthase component II n=1 Tax=uncultured Selenomonas sp. TaxID=159275 RepID=UPI0025E49022|nr:aminodeoxychorismate/anthranilate synthase component II [uncultured Selenomonas sp.]MCI7541196.1 aminodeoxychorismate/anthranilate synthase component II [Veillonellaceae bacterium]MDY6350853.1 aminodeoxychorismate/anthranilate synthase component II [Selenomonas sp.]